MSRCYKMQLYVQKVTKKQTEKIISAFDDCWEKDYFWHDSDGDFFVNGTSNLCAGETEEQFAARLAEKVWSTLGKHIDLSIACGYDGDMENTTVFNLGKKDHKRIMGNLTK